MDYAMPRADDLPSLDLGLHRHALHDQSTRRQKAAAKAGAIAAFPAIANAIADALAPFGVADLTGSATPSRLRNAIGS
jgi:carbon-monoxide dehydrogenase large subunit